MSVPIRLFVGNLPEKINENELRTAFSSYGEITALDIKNKPSAENEKKLFAFITLLTSNYDVESCIQHFTNEDFYGRKLYVTRARESFLERLQRERELAQKKELEKNEAPVNNVTPKPLNINPPAHKRKFVTNNEITENGYDKRSKRKTEKEHHKRTLESNIGDSTHDPIRNHSEYGSKNIEEDDKKQNSDKKRLESLKKKRQEFNQKKLIIKSGLIDIDKASNKKVLFSDDDDITSHQNGVPLNKDNNKVNSKAKKNKLFDEDDISDNEVNFEIKKQFEGKKGQKVLDLQSRYKTDKRFVLDERFIEDDKSDEEQDQNEDENVELGNEDEKYKQLTILQELQGGQINMKHTLDTNKQAKCKLGMLRFNPAQPEHAKFFAPVEKKVEQSKKSKKKKSKETSEAEDFEQQPKEIDKIEVSKETFYKVTDSLKEALEQPSSFSLRSLFAKETETELKDEKPGQLIEHNVPEIAKKKKMKNPLDPGEKNPFVYDSSDSENEVESKEEKEVNSKIIESKPVWREKLFFSESDDRLKDGLLFFTQSNSTNSTKDRRELKTVMKKRVYNKDRKNQMFQKKIGGRRKTYKKSFRKKEL